MGPSADPSFRIQYLARCKGLAADLRRLAHCVRRTMPQCNNQPSVKLIFARECSDLCCTVVVLVQQSLYIGRRSLGNRTEKMELREFRRTQKAIIKEIGNFVIQPHMQWAWITFWQNDNIL